MSEHASPIPHAVSIRGVSKTYKGGFQALKSVDLDIRRGEIFALLGPNGAGKTTLISIICGIVQPSSGTVTADGHDVRRDYRAARMKIGLVPQELSTDAFETVWASVRFSRGLFGRTRNDKHIEKVLRDLSLWEKKDAKIMTLSGGMKRRVLIAKALAHEPDILFLDEPTAGVDIEIRRSMWDFLREINEQGTTIILTTHYLEEAETLCRNIAIINGGLIVERDRMSNLLRRLNTETFVLNLRNSLVAPPRLEGYGTILVDDHTLEVETAKEQNLNDVFGRLSSLGIEVLSMRNKVNRLEEIFMRLVEKRESGAGASGAQS